MSTRRLALFAVFAVVVGTFGCAGEAPQSASQFGSQAQNESSPIGQAPQAKWAGEDIGREFAEPQDAVPDKGAKPAAGGAAAPEQVARRIIYTARLDLIVKDYEAARAEVSRLVGERKGYFAKTDATGDTGSPRTASWTIRVPVDHFRPLLDDLAKLGHPTRNSTDSQDVTEEYVDTEARLKNLKVEEETLNRLLKEAANKVEDVLKVREQLRQVRGDIERFEARLKVLAQLSALSTVHLTVREVKDYVPPTAPTFADLIGTTFGGSVEALYRFGQSAVLFAVALVPWLPLIVVGVLLVRWAVRRSRRSAAQSSP